MTARIVIVITLLIIVELLALRGILKCVRGKSGRRITRWIYISVSAGLLLFGAVYYAVNAFSDSPDPVQFRRFFTLSALLVLNLAPKMLIAAVSLTDDLLLMPCVVYSFIRRRERNKSLGLFRRLLLGMGYILASALLLGLIHGMIWGKDAVEVKHITVTSARLPASFDGFRLVQVSDMHLGSYKDTRHVAQCVDTIIALAPDIMVFTGDMVNNEATEMLPFISHFKKISTPYGRYSILGNHDMGDYRRWYNDREKNCNLNELVRLQEEAGFTMLRNTHVYIRKGADSIALAGVDNWGTPPFKQYGNLGEALTGISPETFTILLSHDPSHWRAEVLHSTPVDLTLSGHTHGFQFALRIGSLNFSPVQFKYSEWGGLYTEGIRYLYVNTGFGFIGYPGRTGVAPEITVIELRGGMN